MPIFVVPGITGLVEDGQMLELDYAGGAATNTASGESLKFKRYPKMIEQIFECGGLPSLARQRYLREQGGAPQGA